ncbi:MAG TPA: hypothetical protein VHL09_11960 [Dehalococcoidia bacterium]|nr:hypothetical protein [Dehalococcoidia bacterium]
MADRDEAQVAHWETIRQQVGAHLRQMRLGTSQAKLSGDLEDLGYRVTQSMISRYEQGVLDSPLSRERVIGWGLCCASLGSREFRELLGLFGYSIPWTAAHLDAFDRLLRDYRQLPLPDQIVLRRKLLWHVLGIEATEPAANESVTRPR